MVGVIAVVVGHWALTTKHALDRGIFNFDSLWYHLPFAVGHGAEPLRDRDASRGHGVHELVLSAELGAAPRGRDAADGAGHAVAVPQLWVAGGGVPGCLVHRQAVRARGPQRGGCGDPARGARAGRARAGGGQERPDGRGADPGRDRDPRQRLDQRGVPRADGPRTASDGCGRSAAGRLAAGGGRAGGGAGRRDEGDGAGDGGGVERGGARAGAARGGAGPPPAWWFVPALLAGGFWYLRNLVVAGNPLPAVESLGPISLPHPERLQVGRPDFSIAHYATDTGVWRHYFVPGPARRLRRALAAGGRGRARWRLCWPC